MTFERIWNAVLAFYGGDPLVAWLLTFALFFLVAAVLVFRRWRRHEERKQADARFARARLNSIVQLGDRRMPR